MFPHDPCYFSTYVSACYDRCVAVLPISNNFELPCLVSSIFSGLQLVTDDGDQSGAPPMSPDTESTLLYRGKDDNGDKKYADKKCLI